MPHLQQQPRITTPVIAKIRGRAVIKRKPERARITAHVRFEGEERDQAMGNLQMALQHLQCECRSMADEPTSDDGDGDSDDGRPFVTEYWASTMTVTMRHATLLDRGHLEGVPLYRASITIRLLFRDFRRMAEFIRTRAGDRHIALEPPVWELTRATREALHKRATRMAYDDAHGQAAMYASALGPGSVTPLQILQPEPGRVTQEEPNREDPGTVREAPPMPLLTVRSLEIEQHDGVPRWDYQLGDDNEFGEGEQRRPRWIEQAPHDVCVEVSCDVTFKIE
ncbi:hypothetical protein V2A60_008621 [Cordyceps javanica]